MESGERGERLATLVANDERPEGRLRRLPGDENRDGHRSVGGVWNCIGHGGGDCDGATRSVRRTSGLVLVRNSENNPVVARAFSSECTQAVERC